jgi:hypothetical protein
VSRTAASDTTSTAAGTPTARPQTRVPSRPRPSELQPPLRQPSRVTTSCMTSTDRVGVSMASTAADSPFGRYTARAAHMASAIR